MVKMLRSMYASVKSCVRVNGSLSQFFDSYMGVKQGESLSPLLFIIFINDMSDALVNGTFDNVTIDEIQIFLLLFADDTVLFSYSKEGLQVLLNQLNTYCLKWGITVNNEKTVVMTFKSGTRMQNIEMFYDGTKLQNVNKFTYLGITLSANGSFYQAQKILAQQAMKALFSLNSLFDVVPLEISEKVKLFDTMVAPILNYGCEIWGFHNAPDIERVHIKFLKQILGVRSQTTNNAVYGELARLPFSVVRSLRIVKYYFKIMKSSDSLMYKVLHGDVDNFGNITNNKSWAAEVKSLLNDLGFNFLWNMLMSQIFK